MAKDFNDIDVRDILNYDHAETAVIARYERIMQHRTIEAMNGLSGRLDGVVEKLVGVMETIHRVGQLAQEKADKAIQAANTATTAQGKQQRAMTALTVALVACTILYTFVNVVMALEMREGNKIQRRIADAAEEQTEAARENNKRQKALPATRPIEPPSQ